MVNISLSHLPVCLNKLAKIMTKDEEKAGVLSAFFVSVFNRKTSSLNAKPAELEVRKGEQHEAHIIHQETVNNLLHHVIRHESMRLVGIHWY